MIERSIQTIVALVAGLTLAGLVESRPALAEPSPPQGAKPDAGGKRIVGILDVRVEGVPKEIAADFETDLEKRLGSQSFWIAPRARVADMMENSTRWTVGCVIGGCVTEVRTQTGAAVVLLASIAGTGTSFGYVVTLVRTDTGTVLSQEADRCDVCTVKEALTNATNAAVKLLTEVPAVLPDESAETRAAALDRAREDAASRAAIRRRHRRAGIATTLIGVAIAAGGAAAYLLGDDRPDYGLATAAAGGGLAAGGVIAIVF